MVLQAVAQNSKKQNKDEKVTEKTSVPKKVLNLMENSKSVQWIFIFTQDEASINAQSNVFEGLYQLDEKDQLPAATDA